MAHTRDLYKTKLCTLFQRGNCPRQSCSFAHGDSELRRFPSVGGGGGGTSFNGTEGHDHGPTVSDVSRALRPNGRLESGYRSGDLRERLERRRSPVPVRRRSPGRDVRGRSGHFDRKSSPRERGGRSRTRTPPPRRRATRSLSAQRSPSHKRRESKRARLDAVDAHFSDVSGEDFGIDDAMAGGDFKPRMRTPPTTNGTLEDQLRQVQAENNTLVDQKSKLEHSLEKKAHETSELSTQNSELEFRLAGANEDYRRLGSKMKMFVRIFTRYIRAQDEVKMTHGRLQKLVEELAAEDGERLNLHANSEIDGISDGEPEQPSHHVPALANHVRSHERVVANHIAVPAAVVPDGSDIEGHVTRKNVSTGIRPPNRESEGNSDTYGDGVGGPVPKRLAPAVLQNNRRVTNRLVVHQQNGFSVRDSDVDDGDWTAGPRPSVRLSLAGATDKSDKAEVKEEFFVPLETKANLRQGAETPITSRSPHLERVKVREVGLPTTLTTHAQVFELERRAERLQGSEMNGPDGEGVNVNLSLASRAYRSNGSDPLSCLLPSSLSIASSHYTQLQYKRHGEDLDMGMGVSGRLENHNIVGDLRDVGGSDLHTETASLQN